MIGFIGALAVTLLVYGGGQIATGNLWAGFTLVCLGCIGLGTLVAAIQSSQQPHEHFDTRDGLTVRQLKLFLAAYDDIRDDTKVYVGDQGLNIAGSVFNCLLDGGRALVIERKAEPGTIAETPHELF